MAEQNIEKQNMELRESNRELADELLRRRKELKDNQHLFNEWNRLMNKIENLEERKFPEMETKISQSSLKREIISQNYSSFEQEYSTMKQINEDTEEKLNELKRTCSAETGKGYTLKTIYKEYLDIYDQTKKYQKELRDSILHVKEHLSNLMSEIKEHRAVYIMMKEEADKIFNDIQCVVCEQQVQEKNIENLNNIINNSTFPAEISKQCLNK